MVDADAFPSFLSSTWPNSVDEAPEALVSSVPPVAVVPCPWPSGLFILWIFNLFFVTIVFDVFSLTIDFCNNIKFFHCINLFFKTTFCPEKSFLLSISCINLGNFAWGSTLFTFGFDFDLVNVFEDVLVVGFLISDLPVAGLVELVEIVDVSFLVVPVPTFLPAPAVVVVVAGFFSGKWTFFSGFFSTVFFSGTGFFSGAFFSGTFFSGAFFSGAFLSDLGSFFGCPLLDFIKLN